MRRWNGWGDENSAYPIDPGALEFIRARLGPGQPLAEASLADVVARVPPGRMGAHPLLSADPEQRVRHARGQSLPDWLAMRSGEFGVFPDAVAFPESRGEVARLLRHAEAEDAVVIPYGGGTSVVGHITPVASERPVMTIDMGRMRSLLDLDPQSRLATFGAGVAGPDLEAQLRARGYTLGHFPQSFELSTLGGWIASRSSGQQSLYYGRIEQLFAGGNIETPRGSLEIPTFPASSAGPDLRELVLGSEGRVGIVTDARVRVKPMPAQESFRVAFLPNWPSARQLVQRIIHAGIPLSMLRLSGAIETETQLVLAGHPRLVSALQRYLQLRGAADGKCMLTYGVTGTKAHCRAALKSVAPMIAAAGGIATGARLGDKWRRSRFRTPYLRESLWQQGYLVDTLETATDWPFVDTMVDEIEAALRGAIAPQPVHVFTHLSHIYPQGCSVYTTYLFKMADSYEASLARWRRLKQRASAAVVEHRGTISHQHGVGADHAAWLGVEKGELGLGALGALCQYFDPDGRMNPGKLLPPAPPGERE